MPRKRPPNPQNTTTSPSPAPPQPSPPSPSSFPNTLPLPLNLTEAECVIIFLHMHLNIEAFDNSVAWWNKIHPFFPDKTVQELRAFNYLFVKSYNELAADRGWMSDREMVRIPWKEICGGLPTQKECITLMELLLRNRAILSSKGGLEEIAGHFPGKNASDIGRFISLLRMNFYFMGKSTEECWKSRLFSARDERRKKAENDELEEDDDDDDDDDEVCIRPSQEEDDEQSAPSTSEWRSFSERFSRSRIRRGSRSRAGRYYGR